MTSQQAEMLQTTVLADVAIILAAGVVFVSVSRFLRQPTVIGEILAGIALGPSLLGLLPGDLTARVFPTEARPLLSAIAQIGLLLFMFILGWELDPRLLSKSKEAVAAVTVGSIVLPFALGIGAAAMCYGDHSIVAGKQVPFLAFALYVGVSMSVTAFPVLARILTDSGLGQTRVGVLALASAALGDIVAWCLLAVIIGLATTGSATGGFAVIIGWSAVYIIGMAVLVRPLLAKVTSRLVERGRTLHLVALVATGVFLSSCATSLIGIHAIFGAFAFGIVMPRHPRRTLEPAVQQPLQNIARFLLPVYFVVTGLSVDVRALGANDWLVLGLLLTVACVGKVVGATLPARWTGLPWRESLGVGVLMNTRGLTELIILNVGLSLDILDDRLFTIMVLVALITTGMAGPLLPSLVKKPKTDTAAPVSGTVQQETVPSGSVQ
ncbi:MULTISPECIES: cation:proton antiporter domain-containing protein [unclassified Streptomyces]|uniref:cation:proton antiporter domain-containing protein n=1 Tax=unclassified Streptomyces TaxID=2593676 RepID=UPI0022560E0E|nr:MULTISPECIES: cation:proton antiporter [unclassified Streptomyces]WSP53045.1 cation:proton antiporter [Streptomyces sp. NBC_01241]WSU19642.1 cation:proton antiporter [Streptomyces sp. NBC_01108]MCX4800054.1 cation:proton antiporter [Streptomyces sp. NBC_01242]WSJ40757.1 cation:proton antiporter [Streptomyces sp. NBC_01321]WSP59806.1 cation:proton antiporter [Streptomyces sp. NBC_01241]